MVRDPDSQVVLGAALRDGREGFAAERDESPPDRCAVRDRVALDRELGEAALMRDRDGIFEADDDVVEHQLVSARSGNTRSKSPLGAIRCRPLPSEYSRVAVS